VHTSVTAYLCIYASRQLGVKAKVVQSACHSGCHAEAAISLMLHYVLLAMRVLEVASGFLCRARGQPFQTYKAATA